MSASQPQGFSIDTYKARCRGQASGVALACTTLLAAGIGMSGMANAEEGDTVTSAIELTIPAEARLRIDIPVGELRLVGTDGDQLQAVMSLSCRSSNKRCAERAEAARFVQEIDGQDVTLGVEPDGMGDYNDTSMVVEIAVPAAESLALKFGAGELELRDVDACTSLRMFAGEANIYTTPARVSEVDIKAQVGEAILVVGNQEQVGERALLVGAKVNWQEGSGDCELNARLRFGEITAHLSEE